MLLEARHRCWGLKPIVKLPLLSCVASGEVGASQQMMRNIFSQRSDEWWRWSSSDDRLAV